MEFLAKKIELYRTMAYVFYKRLDKDERIDALTEVALMIREEEIDEI